MSISISGGSDEKIIKEVGEKTIEAINNLNKSTAQLNKIMIWLTGALVLLTIVLVWLTFKLAFPR
jgi:preprotein translocase subunit SecG